jgi:hypothetical protein
MKGISNGTRFQQRDIAWMGGIAEIGIATRCLS